MSYDIIDGGTSEEEYEFFTIGNLIDLALDNPDKVLQFIGTCYSPDALHSWRGDYSMPAIDYTTEPKTGSEISKVLLQGLDRVHIGWKGGDYRYTRNDQFYVAHRGCADEYKIIGCEIDGDLVVLLTKLDPY